MKKRILNTLAFIVYALVLFVLWSVASGGFLARTNWLLWLGLLFNGVGLVLLARKSA